jgi:N-acetyl sugar amidotransferase
MPTTRPDTAFVDGECSACINYRRRAEIDWKAREAELLRILETAPKNGSGYDCIVPSSGGKDSTYQVIRLLELGAKPLVVTASTCMLTDVGRRNIDNLARYATTIEVTPNREVRRKLNRLGLQMVGDVSLPEHMAIFSTPFRVAADLGIPTLFYGECPQDQYGGPLGTEAAKAMTRRWTMEFGGYLGVRPADLIGEDGITAHDMAEYMLPPESKMGVITAYWLGQFEPWDSHRNARVAEEHGMESQQPSAANWWEFENLDCALTGLHDHAMYRKYGYGRGCAQISVDVRSGVFWTRADALDWVEYYDGLFPHDYMGYSINDVAHHLDMTTTEIKATLDRFTNWALFDGVIDDRPILKEFADCSQPA